jgi:hypothetical protein
MRMEKELLGLGAAASRRGRRWVVAERRRLRSGGMGCGSGSGLEVQDGGSVGGGSGESGPAWEETNAGRGRTEHVKTQKNQKKTGGVRESGLLVGGSQGGYKIYSLRSLKTERPACSG